MGRYVPAEGNLSARIAVVAEAPAKQEELRGRPLVGGSGARWEEWTRSVGLQRSMFYISNVHKYRAPKANKIETVPKAELQQSIYELQEELTHLTDPWVIVPMGNVALRAITGKNSILNWRGSILECNLRDGRTVKVIPTIHPAATFRTAYWEKRCRLDWARIASELQTREVHVPERERFINPTMGDLEDFYARAQRADALAIDIETPRKVTHEIVRTTKKGKPVFKKLVGPRRITMVGFADAPDFSFTIPTTEAYWGSEDAAAQAWHYIRMLCKLPCTKILQFGMFDSFWLRRFHGINIANYLWDVGAMHHAMDSADDHSLEYLASIDTREPFWKKSGKDNDEDEDDPSDSGFDEYQRYNGTDCCVEYELANLYAARLTRNGLLQFYHEHYSSLFEPLLDLMLHGVAVNDKARRVRLTRLNGDIVRIQDRLTELAGYKLYGKKSLSGKKLQQFLYDDLHIKKEYKSAFVDGERTRKVTLDEIALRKIAQKNKANALVQQVTGLVMEHRRAYQVSTFLQEGKADADSRIRCQYRFTTEFMRLASRRNPLGTGRNLQNLDREILDIFEPDAGKIFMECDCSQIEDRQTKVYAYNVNQDPSVLARARSMPWENDEHRRAASVIFKIPPDKVTPAQRYLGKRTRHATNYGMMGKTLSEQLMKEGYVFVPDECQAFIDMLKRADTYIEDYQRDCRMQLIRTRELTNSWGRIFNFRYVRLDDDLFRRGYACRPQSDTGILLNQWGLKPLWHYLRDHNIDARINMQVHDSVKFSILPQDVVEVGIFLKRSLERERYYGKTKLSVPVEFKLGINAKCEHEFKRIKWREFEECAYALAAERANGQPLDSVERIRA